jgi:hypothetical protein
MARLLLLLALVTAVVILGAGDVEVRMLACEALGRIPSDTSLRYLLGFFLGEGKHSAGSF